MCEIVAFGPVSIHRPCIPERLIIKKGDIYISITYTTEIEIDKTELDKLISTREIVPMMPFVDLEPGFWVCVGTSTPEVFPKAEEAKFRATKAMSLLEQAQACKGTTSLELLQSCARMINLDLKNLIKQLESNRKSKTESFVDIFQRIK